MNYQAEFFGKELLAICNYSGGLLSWKAAQLAVQKWGKDHVALLYADTGNESEDNYRFIVQGAALLKVPLHIVRAMPDWAGGRMISPFDVAFHYGFLPAYNAPVCSSDLKRAPLDKWIAENSSQETKIVIGFGHEETERAERMRRRFPKKKYYFPLLEKPYHFHCEIEHELRALGVEPPKSYKMGFGHANCNDACLMGGKGHFVNLYLKKSEVFAKVARFESRFRRRYGRTLFDKTGTYTLFDLIRDYKAGKLSKLTLENRHTMCACGVMWDDDRTGISPVFAENDYSGDNDSNSNQ